jgi:hypothetical protein
MILYYYTSGNYLPKDAFQLRPTDLSSEFHSFGSPYGISLIAQLQSNEAYGKLSIIGIKADMHLMLEIGWC